MTISEALAALRAATDRLEGVTKAFNPDQPRVPEGEHGGEWTAEGGPATLRTTDEWDRLSKTFDPEAKAAMLAELARVQALFPGISVVLDAESRRGHAPVARADWDSKGNRIIINSAAQGWRSGRFGAGEFTEVDRTPSGIMRHEFGHIFAYRFGKEMPAATRDQLRGVVRGFSSSQMLSGYAMNGLMERPPEVFSLAFAPRGSGIRPKTPEAAGLIAQYRALAVQYPGSRVDTGSLEPAATKAAARTWARVKCTPVAIGKLIGKADSEEDHFYGAWTGGSAASGGHPKGKPKPKTEDKTVWVDGDEMLIGNVDRVRKALGESLVVENPGSAPVERALIDLALVKPKLLQSYADSGGKVRLMEGPITDVRKDLASKHPRGWHAGATFKEVSGGFDPGNLTAYVGNEAPHGSVSVALHEVGHGMDTVLAFPVGPSSRPEFVRAWNEMQRSTNVYVEPYYMQKSGAGQEETWAEAFAIRMKKGPDGVTDKFGRGISDFVELWLAEDPGS